MRCVHRRSIVVSLLLGTVLSVSPVLADPGATVHLGPATFVDTRTGITFSVELKAGEFVGAPGKGSVALLLKHPTGVKPLSLCSAHGPAAVLDMTTGVGNFPLQDIQCGTAGGMVVAIDRCVADIEAHGYMHADHPFVTYLGMITVGMRVNRERGHDGADVEITIWTPKEKIMLKGRATGDVTMSTCPW